MYKKMQRIEQNQKQEKKLMFLERYVNASYLGVLTRFQHKMNFSLGGTSLYMITRVFPTEK